MSSEPVNSLRSKVMKSGATRLVSQAGGFAIRLGSIAILARLLDPKDFGLVGMVTAFTGILGLFRDFGLSAASVQRSTISEEQTSALFWINVAVGGALALLAAILSPAIAVFYHEPRLTYLTAVIGLSFFLNGCGVQHSAVLQRRMQFSTLAAIDILALVTSTAIGIWFAWIGFGYWALAVMTVSLPLVTTSALWIAARWIPSRPRSASGLRSIIRFGGLMTLNGLVMYIASNFEKVLLGRYWGIEATGIYGRAYQLVRIPTDNLNSAVGEVAFAALALLQNEPVRLKSYFLKGYSLVLALTVPITVACALFADDVIQVALGSKWSQTVPIFRLLAPTILVFAVVNPLGWLLNSLGLVERGFKIALAFAPFIIAGYWIGLPYGPQGVAVAYSAVMVLWLFPFVAWAVHNTVISIRNVFEVLMRPIAASIAGAAVACPVRMALASSPTLLRMVAEAAVLGVVYVAVLLILSGRDSVYRQMLLNFRRRPQSKEGFASV